MPTFSTLPVRLCLRSFSHRGNTIDRSIQPDGGIDAVREEVTGDTGTGSSDIESPEGGASLGQVGVDGPVLQEIGAVMEDASEPSFVDESLGE